MYGTMADSTQHYDYIFAGFGLSGMTLLHELSKNGALEQKRILILDQDQKNKNDRTWSFWSKGNLQFEFLAKKSWERFIFYDQFGKAISRKLANYKYYTIEGLSLYQYMLNMVNDLDQVHLHHEKILEVTPEGLVKTDQAAYSANKVFKSYFVKDNFPDTRDKLFIWQHFYGWFIKTTEDLFDESEFTIMDYRESQGAITNFFYILPFSKNEALIEFTEFSKTIYDEGFYKEQLKGYMQKYFDNISFDIIHREFNAIPMTNFRFKMVESAHVINIGTMAGYIKPSSGYGFSRTVRKNRKLAGLLKSGGEITESQLQQDKIFEVFDDTVLDLLSNQHLHGALLYDRLFERISPDVLFDFLDEKLPKTKLLKIMMVVPEKWKFIQAFFRNIT